MAKMLTTDKNNTAGYGESAATTFPVSGIFRRKVAVLYPPLLSVSPLVFLLP